MTTRLPVPERRRYADLSKRVTEPALGTVTERLDNIIRRQGGRPTLRRLSSAAFAAELQLWEDMSASAWRQVARTTIKEA